MRRIMLFAGAAALVASIPVLADPGGKGQGRGNQAAQGQQGGGGGGGGQAREQRGGGGGGKQQRAERPERAERRQQRAERPERAERRQQRAERPERIERRQQRAERGPRPQQAERRWQRAERSERAERRQQRAERPQRAERRQQRVDRGQQRESRRELRQARREANPRRTERRGYDQDRRLVRNQERQVQQYRDIRQAARDGRRYDRIDRQAALRQSVYQDQARWQPRYDYAESFAGDRIRYRGDDQAGFCPPGLAKKNPYCLPPGQLRKAGLIGQRASFATWDYNVPDRYRYRFEDSNDSFYRYGDDGYVYGYDRSSGLIDQIYPLAATGLFPGEPLPIGYDVYNVPMQWRSYYPDQADYSYRYDDGAIYGVDPQSGMIEGIVALLAGGGGLGGMGGLGIGDTMPDGYDAYNVPIDYRDDYYDSDEAYYRYADNNIYQVDPQTGIIESIVSLLAGGGLGGGLGSGLGGLGGGLGGFGGGLGALSGLGIGDTMPSGYDVYNVPTDYRDEYYDTDDAYYRYADNNIYQVDPQTGSIESIVSLLAGGIGGSGGGLGGALGGLGGGFGGTSALAGLGIGDEMPSGYDVYNVPMEYRDDYYDTDDSYYRYADNNIYQVDPQTEMIEQIISLLG